MRLTLLRPVCVWAVSLLLGLGVIAPVAAAPDESRRDLVVLVGVSGLRWSDISATGTPNLFAALDWNTGSLSSRSVGEFSCPADGWLAVSSGARARGGVWRAGEPCPAVAAPTAGRAGGWDGYQRQAAADPYAATPGLFGQAVHDAGVPMSGVGAGAAIALADRNGQIQGSWESLSASADQARQLRRMLGAMNTGGLFIADLGGVPASLSGRSRDAALTTLDDAAGRTLAAVPTSARVMLASLSDNGSDVHLQVVAQQGQDLPGFTASPSTRQPELGQVTDVAPTLLELLGIDAPDTFVGSPLNSHHTDANQQDRLSVLRDADLRASAVRAAIPAWVVATYLPGLAMVGWLLWRRSRLGKRWPRWTRLPLLMLALTPTATFLANLVPWWRADWPTVAALEAVFGTVLVLALPALLIPAIGRRPMRAYVGYPATVTFVMFWIDLVTGSRLQACSIMGLQPQEGGRFYGLGNPAFALFATATLMLGAAIAHELNPARPPVPLSRPSRIAAASAMTVGVIGVGLDGTPGWGSDFGGPPAFLPGVVLLGLMIAGIRVTLPRLLAVAGVTLVVVTGLALIDWLRPAASRTHLGRAVQTLLDGELGPVVARKLAANLALIVSTPFTVLIPIAFLATVVLFVRPDRWPSRFGGDAVSAGYQRYPVLRPLTIAWLVTTGIAFLANDSGAVVPPIGATLLAPALLALCSGLPGPAQLPIALVSGEGSAGEQEESDPDHSQHHRSEH